jgi:acetylglutamate kinase
MDDQGNLVTSVDASTVTQMIREGTISGGMIPKLEYALDAIENGVEKVQIINGTKRHALLLELFTDQGIGTQVTAQAGTEK